MHMRLKPRSLPSTHCPCGVKNKPGARDAHVSRAPSLVVVIVTVVCRMSRDRVAQVLVWCRGGVWMYVPSLSDVVRCHILSLPLAPHSSCRRCRCPFLP